MENEKKYRKSHGNLSVRKSGTHRCAHFIQHLSNIYLQGFEHEAVAAFHSMWSLSSVPKLKDFLYAVTDENKKALLGSSY